MSYDESLEDRIDHRFIDRKELIKNKQMGSVGWLLNGNMCFGIYDNLLVVRIDPDDADFLSRKPGIELFGQQDNETGTFISISGKIHQYPQALEKFLDHALTQTAQLPPNEQEERGCLKKDFLSNSL